MLEYFTAPYAAVAKWLNDNQGVVGVGVFGATLLFGWASGIFGALRRKPKFRIRLIEGPTFACTFPTGKKHDELEIHRTGIALYLSVANIGSAASSIEEIEVGYHWNVGLLGVSGVRYRFGWFWLRNQTPAIHDFQSKIGENVKIYPFLTQRSSLASGKGATFLEPGRSTNGVVYFEQTDSWGGCFPLVRSGKVRVKIVVRDVFGKSHVAKHWIRSSTLAESREYNPSFGKTHAELRNETLPHDASI